MTRNAEEVGFEPTGPRTRPTPIPTAFPKPGRLLLEAGAGFEPTISGL